MMTRSVSRIALVLAMAAAGLTPLAAFAETASAATETPAPVLPAITVSPVKVAALSDRIFAGGLVQALETVQVAPLIEGQPIDALLVEVGDKVAQGQVLARLSKTTLELSRSQLVASVAAARATVAQAEAQVLEAEASAAEAQRVADRARALRDGGNASQAALDQAQTSAMAATARVTVARQSLEAARAQATSVDAQLANVELNLTRTEVTAPVAGEIVARNAQVGAIASAAGQPMFTLVRDGALELRVELAERDLIRIATGQAAQLRVAGSPRSIPGTVRLVEPTVDQSTRLGHARIRLDEPGILIAGMFADAEILVTRRSGLSVPVTAVSTGADGTAVMRVDAQGNVARVVVETGIRDAGMVEITSGLTGGDRVVTKAGAFVRDGDRVNPVLAASN
ncbi:efflux RND transporter periplasmic adaptor subunit [Gemmobacter sp.]|uniref:efflux RND transporter periplasmic adaptor subunit n=1 Tax=Gemmobacter sp. TaxID=1898957 RepID=UPI002AFE384A|nr:efflux RND transporter periplasmic adaptor subunit [Gemmobacter sp.]